MYRANWSGNICFQGLYTLLQSENPLLNFWHCQNWFVAKLLTAVMSNHSLLG
jgi:hypothetical protein